MKNYSNKQNGTKINYLSVDETWRYYNHTYIDRELAPEAGYECQSLPRRFKGIQVKPRAGNDFLFAGG